MKKLLGDTYPIGKILMVDTSAILPELWRGIKRVQDKLEELREAIRNAEDILKETDTYKGDKKLIQAFKVGPLECLNTNYDTIIPLILLGQWIIANTIWVMTSLVLSLTYKNHTH